ncbi:PadR family transcriptional regulator [Fonticella tunisiensis]|uniref:DNA-binding PadR family transcriptional regulator n=1 Tax=Fonticella tunisiensis TaxID=1096341 RepID=A0A4R7KQQ0_9CLOT|nr:PadR family transcriptional regulator [Fonticella tunisiensis]TDT61540.1 DNA-binding PadR family transcriptional regulator [Fonticella tunisiensis]
MTDGSNRNRQFPNKMNTTTIVKMLILHFLSKKSCYGNELIDLIEINLNYKWKPSPGMIYPLLRSMEDDLLIEGWWDEPDKKTKRHYRITETGIKHYDKIKSLYKPLLEESLSIIDSVLKTIY